MTECEVPRQQLEQLHAGFLTGGEKSLLEEHLPNCPRCIQILDTLAQADSPFPLGLPIPVPEPVGTDGQKFLAKLTNLTPPEPAPTFPGPYTDDAPLGLLAGKYKMLRKIGNGTYGFVYEASDPQLGRNVAIKVLKPMVAEIPGAGERFLAEAKKAASVKDSNVVVVHEVLEPTSDFPWPAFVMEFLSGGSLEQLLETRGGSLDSYVSARYIRQTALGLAKAHSKGLIHRDIKPANLLLDDTLDIVKIADFGVARALEGISRPQGGSTHGTLEFMSPEQLFAPEKVGSESDVYNLGATLYNLVTGHFPFAGERRPEQDLIPPRQHNPKIPVELEAVIRKCLVNDPSQRYTATALAEDLDHFLNEEPVNARSHSLWELLALWNRRSPRVVALFAALLLSLIGITITSIVFAFQAYRSATEARQNAERSRETAQLIQEGTHALSRAGVFAVMAGQREEAKAFFDTAIRVRERLVQLSDLPEYRLDLALARMHLGNWHLTAGRYAAAIEAYDQARPELVKLVQSNPDEARFRFQLANTLDNHGMALLALYRPEEAEACHQLALNERKHLVGPADKADQMMVAYHASTLNHLGNALKKQGNAEQAGHFYGESITLLEKLTANFPEVRSHQQELGYGCINLGTLHVNTGKLKDAEPFLRRAVQLQEQLYKLPTKLSDYGAEYGAGLVCLGELEWCLEHFDKALKCYDNSLEPIRWTLDRVPDHPAGQRYLAEAHAGRAVCLLALGRTDEGLQAGQDAATIATKESIPGESLVKVARALARASVSVKAAAQKEHYAKTGVDLLGKATESGYFKLQPQAGELQSADLAPLRDRPDFNALHLVVVASQH